MIRRVIDYRNRYVCLCRVAVCSVFGILAMLPQPARGVTIIWADKAASGFDTTEAAVVDAAIAKWGKLIIDFGPLSGSRSTFTVSIKETPTSGIGVASGFTTGPGGIPLSGSISIDDGTFAASFGGFFVDPTPGTNGEYAASSYVHYGTATPSGLADGKKDLLTVVVHELGHVLGFEDSYTPWSLRIFPSTTLNYDISPPTKTAALSDADHLAHVVSSQPFDLMASAGDLPSLGIGDRRLPSALDLDIMEGIYFYTVDRSGLESFDGLVVPEPSTLVMVACGLLSGLCLYWRRFNEA